MKMHRIQKILSGFKSSSKRQGWKTCETEDWIQNEEGFHNFLFAMNVRPCSFKKMASTPKCVVREDLSYRVVESSYTAWLFPETLSGDLIKMVTECPDFSNRIALYDLSLMLEGKNVCLKSNNTGSSVFREFEKYLRKEYNIRFESAPTFPKTGIETRADPIQQFT
jgi:hypothetical protein